MIGTKEGYGLGEYRTFDISECGSFGPDFDAIIAMFDRKRGDKALNSKSDVSPVELKEYLCRVSFLTPVWDEAGRLKDARVTLHGSEVAAAYTDNTGHLVSEIHKPRVANRVLATMQQAADLKAGIFGTSEERDGPQPHARLNILYWPLSQDGETISHFFAYVRLDPLD